MEEDKKILRRVSEDGVVIGYNFMCEGCEIAHYVDNRWSFNGDMEKPTFTPSILRRSKAIPTDEECERILSGETVELADLVCHSYITDGKIQYLNDCTHKLSGQTVNLKPF